MRIAKNSIYIFMIIMVNILTINTAIGQHKKFTNDMLNNPGKYGKKFERLFNLNELDVYDTTYTKGKVVLNNGYAHSRILNPEDWPAYRKNIVVTQIDVIYTKYPRN